MWPRARCAATALLAASLAASCRHAAPPARMAPAPAPAPAAPADGAVSLHFLGADGASGPPLSPGQRFVAPFYIERPLPEFPAEALAASPPPSQVVVRILVDTMGRIARITDSPLAVSTPGPFAQAYRAAVEAALARWALYPGHIDTYTSGEDVDGNGVADEDVLVSFTPIEVYYDVSFEFRVVAGKGAVTLSPGP